MPTGRIVNIATEELATTLTAAVTAGATTLNVDSVRNFNEEGGLLTINGSAVIGYTTRNVDANTLTLATGAPAAPMGAYVAVDPAGSRRWALVALDDAPTDGVLAAIPYEMSGFVAEDGYREYWDRESVRVEVVNQQFTVIAIYDKGPGLDPATMPEITSDMLEDGLYGTILSANGRNKTTWSPNAPTNEENALGDTWWHISAGGDLIGQYQGQGGTSWVERQIGNEVIAHLDAAKIQTGWASVSHLLEVDGILQVGGLSSELASKETPAGAQSKADAAAEDAEKATNEAQWTNTNPVFATWPVGQALPTSYAPYGNTAFTREQALPRTGPNAVRSTITDFAAQESGMYVNTGLPSLEYITVEMDFYLVSGGISGAGIILDWVRSDATYVRTMYSIASDLGTSLSVGKWYRWTKVFKRPNTWSGTYSQTRAYIMGEYTAFGGALKDLIIDKVGMRPSSVEEITAFNAPADAQAKADAAAAVAQSNAIAAAKLGASKVNNFSVTGTLDGWSTGQTQGLVTVDFNGTNILALKTTSTGDVSAGSSDWFDVDPTKAYAVSVWIMRTYEGGTPPASSYAYFGTSQQNIGAATVTPVNKDTGATLADSGNFYFLYRQPPASVWENWIGYIFPTAAVPDDMAGLGTYGQYNARMRADAKKMLLRFLNYYNAGVQSTVYIAHPTVTEVSLEAVKAASLTERWRTEGATTIEGGLITTNSIKVDAIDVDDLKAKVLEAGFALLGNLDVQGSITVGQGSWSFDNGFYFPGIIHIPSTVGARASITCDVVAQSLTVQQDLNILGTTNKLSGALTISNGVTKPTTPPSVWARWEDFNLDAQYEQYGLAPQIGSSTTVLTCSVVYGTSIHGFNKNDGSSVNVFGFGKAWQTNFNATGGITTIGSNYFVLGWDMNRNNAWFIYKLDSGFNKVSELGLDSATLNPSLGRPTIGNNGTQVLIAQADGGNGVNVRIFTTTPAWSSSYTIPNFTGIGLSDLGFIGTGLYDFGVQKTVIAVSNIMNFVVAGTGSTGDRAADLYAFPRANNAHIRGLHYDGSLGRFLSLASNDVLAHHGKNISAKSATASYTFYDGNATNGTHETDDSPTTAFTWPARTWLTMQTSPPPDYGSAAPNTDKANMVRFYVGVDGGQPRLQGTSIMKADGVTPVLIMGWDTISTTSALAPTNDNGFIGSTASPGIIQSATGGFVLNGDGTGAWPAIFERPAIELLQPGVSSVPTGTYTLIQSYTASPNTRGSISYSAGVVTINETGWYQISAQGNFYGAVTQRVVLRVEKFTGTQAMDAGVDLIMCEDTIGGAPSEVAMGGSRLAYLTQNEKFRLWVWHNSGGAISGGNFFLTVHKV